MIQGDAKCPRCGTEYIHVPGLAERVPEECDWCPGETLQPLPAPENKVAA